MEKTRLVELSLYYKLKDVLSRSRTGEIATSANFSNYNLKYSSIQTQYPVTVHVNTVTYNSSGYSVDYINGKINFNVPLTSSDVVSVDYTYCPINIYDESTSPESNDFKYPALAVYEYEREDIAYELGSNSKELHPTWIIDVWAERGGERNDITDIVASLFDDNTTIPVIDFNQGFPTNSDGTINTSFDSSKVIGYMFTDSIKYRKGGSLNIGDKPRFMSEIFTDLTIIF